MTPKDGDVVVLVMPGVSVAYLALVHEDGEQLDTIKERLTVTKRSIAFKDAQRMIEVTGGRVLQWMSGAAEPEPWPNADGQPTATA